MKKKTKITKIKDAVDVYKQISLAMGRVEWTEEEREHYRRTGEKPTAKVLALDKGKPRKARIDANSRGSGERD